MAEAIFGSGVCRRGETSQGGIYAPMGMLGEMPIGSFDLLPGSSLSKRTDRAQSRDLFHPGSFVEPPSGISLELLPSQAPPT